MTLARFWKTQMCRFDVAALYRAKELGRIGYGVEIWTGQPHQGEKPVVSPGLSKQVMK